MQKVHPLVIVGAGPAGLYLSIFLSQHKVPHILLEQAEELQNIGFGILIQENLFTCLNAIGIAKESLSFATITKLEAIRTNGVEIIDVRVAHTPIYSTKRSEILRVLLEKLDAKNLITSKRVTFVKKRGDGLYELQLQDDSSLLASYVVGADGIKSVVRDCLFQRNVAKKVYSALYFWIKDEDKHTMKSLTGGGANTLIMPTSTEDSILFVCTTKSFAPDKMTNEAICRDILSSFGESSEEILKKVLFEKNSLLTFVQRTKNFKFAKGKAVLIGDAAHGETPILGWGTTISLEDAYTLGSLLIKGKGYEKSFQKFYSMRKKRAKTLHMITTIEESLLGVFDDRKSFVREVILYCVRPLDSILFNQVRRLYKKLNSYTLTV